MNFIKIFYLALAIQWHAVLYRYEMNKQNPHPSEKLMGLFLKRKPHPILELHKPGYQSLVINFEWGLDCQL